VLLARTSKAAARLSEQFRERTVEKTYLALVEGTIAPAEGRLEDRLSKDRQKNLVTVVDDRDDGQDCVLTYRRLRKIGRLTLVEVHPETGRSHQIRVQLAAQGWPIVGDRKYGSKYHLDHSIALHASALKFMHPTSREMITITCDQPKSWSQFESLS
jgi:23S rRNA pseudouridine1911/1915/1917 synthase